MGKYLQTYTVCKDWNSQQRTVFSISILRDAKVNQKEKTKKQTKKTSSNRNPPSSTLLWLEKKTSYQTQKTIHGNCRK